MVTLFALFNFSANVFAHAEAKFEYLKVDIKGPITMLYGAGGNIAVLQGEEGLLVVDNGLAENANNLEKALDAYGETAKYVLNTHWHYDHSGANPALGDKTTIVAHDNVRVRLLNGGQILGNNIPPSPKHALPDITYQQKTTLHFADLAVEIQHYPNGHTDGDSVVFFKPANVVHMGDLMFQGKFPFIDISSGGSVNGYIQNVGEIIGLINDQTIVIPGHGEVTDKAGLTDFHNMMKETLETVQAMKSDGKTLEQVQTSGLPSKWKEWGTGFINEQFWIELLWNAS